MPSATEAGVYAFKSMEAGLYDPPIVAMRIGRELPTDWFLESVHP